MWGWGGVGRQGKAGDKWGMSVGKDSNAERINAGPVSNWKQHIIFI